MQRRQTAGDVWYSPAVVEAHQKMVYIQGSFTRINYKVHHPNIEMRFGLPSLSE